ncbi:J domain-containing protein [Paraburkholderia sp. SEWSISQ10-3 4]|uniref:J domain-containing protein n=1 Tax=Paraburkholderia TaxID=1822464 RepID=UPI0022505CAF|nr:MULTISPECIES: J domain-containing protein [Paraburkholderia]MCX4137341.1 J domain-containing protein [Paraburkholderia aspalathi]MDN7170033.1 J domain-containing protein [Paraburkholderia sp. SEWSISQ10-3 4]MDQ6499672.1 J domain-containing protein [Paraburkholderia aspalathi]
MDTTSAHHWPWDVLGVAANADERTVRRAYARLLKQQRPDEDAEAFQRLRYAYESALQMASGGGVAATIAAVSASVPVPVSVPSPPPEAHHLPEHDAFESAVQLWQHFVSQRDQLESRRSLQDLFAAVVNIQMRDELEWQALVHCLNEDAPATLRMNLSAVLGWRDNAAHLRRRNAAIATLALDRVFADEDYNALRLRFTNAMALLEGPQPPLATGAHALLRAGVRTEMEQLLTALARYHPNVVRLRLDSEKVEFWTRCLSFRIGAGRLFGPALALSAWCGLLFANASMNLNSNRWLDQWTPVQLAVLLATLMVTLVTSAATTVLLSEPQQQRLRTLRSIGWLRYGWIPVWLGATAAALCDAGSGRLTSIAMDTLGICTMWAALIYGWPRIKQLAVLAAVGAIGFGFAGHWLSTDSRAWQMPFAHGVLFAFFFSFAQQEFRGWLAGRPRVAWVGMAMWFAGFVTLIVLLLQREERSTQFAWALFTVMAAAGGVLATTRWSDLRGAVPPFFRGYVHLVWLALAISKPDIIACVSAGLMSVWIIEELKQRRLSHRTAL